MTAYQPPLWAGLMTAYQPPLWAGLMTAYHGDFTHMQ